MIRGFKAAAAVLAASLTAMCAGTDAAPPDTSIRLSDCEVPGLTDVPAKCGTYLVWENRAGRAGRQIAINVAVFPSRGAQRSADPIFYFQGGPGGSAIDAAGNIVRLIASLHATRDLVFVDVRGTGRSSALRCPAAEPDAPLQAHLDDFLSDEYVRRCLAHQTADVRFYTQPFAMDDVEDVRKALGYARINLFGASGGTRQAQIYMRRHPSSVRAAVLHGVQPMDAEMPLAFSRALDAGVQGLIAACSADQACSTRHPSLAADWQAVNRAFDAGPREVVVNNPRSGRRETVRLTRGVFADGVRHMLYDLNGWPEVAERIHEAARGEFETFARREMEQRTRFERSISFGMYLSATCAEDVRFIDEDDVRRATAGTFLGDYRVRRQQSACRIWPRGEGIDDRFQEPVRSPVPVLVLSGELDPATPPSEGERVTRAFPNARHVVFPNQSHNLANRSCAARLIHQFIDQGSTDGLDTGCVAQTRRRPFGE